jgi:hypothetical protein
VVVSAASVHHDHIHASEIRMKLKRVVKLEYCLAGSNPRMRWNRRLQDVIKNAGTDEILV